MLSKDGHPNAIHQYHSMSSRDCLLRCLDAWNQDGIFLTIQSIVCSGRSGGAGEDVQGQWGKAQQLLLQ